VANRRKWTDEQFVGAVQAARSIRQFLQSLGLNATGANYRTAQDAIARLGLDTSHFLGKGYLRGSTHEWGKSRPFDSLLVENSDYSNVSYLKRRMLAAGMLRDECCLCGLTEWLGRPISLVLDHVNGNNRDHRMENLRLLCPNCNSQQETFAGRNKARRRRTEADRKPPGE
jgi:hypothetical protein